MTQAEYIEKLREALIIARGGLLEAIGTSHNMVPAYNAFLNRAEEAVRLALALPSPAEPIPRGVDPVETWASRLPPSYGAMLRAIAKSRRGLEKLEIAAEAGVSPTSSGLTAGVRELVDLALIEEADDKYILAQGLR